MRRIQRWMVRAALVALLPVSAGGCANAGALGDVLGGVLGGGAAGGAGGQQGELRGRVRYVDGRSGTLEVESNRGVARIRVDNRTVVEYQGQQYQVTSLEQGDEITLRVQQVGQNELYSDYIRVDRNVRGDTGGGAVGGQAYALEGTVQYVDANRGVFEVSDRNGARTTITLPYRPAQDVEYRFRNLRRGDFVRMDVNYVAQGRAELSRFR